MDIEMLTSKRNGCNRMLRNQLFLVASIVGQKVNSFDQSTTFAESSTGNVKITNRAPINTMANQFEMRTNREFDVIVVEKSLEVRN